MTAKMTRATASHLRSNLTSTKTLLDSLVRLNPASLIANPVMFIVELTFFIVAAMAIYPPAFYPVASSSMRVYYVEVALILLITVWFSTLADALAETQAKNTARSLRSLESEVQSKKIVTEGDVRKNVSTPSTTLRKGDLILLEKNDIVPIDAEVTEGIGMVDESLLTGESIALYVCLLPTTIGALLPSIGLSGISRLYRRRIVAKSGRAVERAGDTDVIILDKTGTITVGNRQAVEFIPFERHTEKEVGEAAFLSSWHDDTPEGRSLIRLAYEDGFVPRRRKFEAHEEAGSVIGEDETEIIKGAPDAIKKIARSIPSNFDALVDRISGQGDTPLALTRNREAIGIIRLKDVLKPGIKEKILSVKVMGIRPVMLTGDQPLTAKSIANEVGIDEYRPEAKPEDKYDIVMKEQAETRVVAMIGDGTNDAPALAVADVGLAMNSGTQAAKEAANMVDLESNPAKIIEVVLLGKQLLMTRGAVTTFSIANDVAKYFAIVPVMFAATLPELKSLNILGLGLNTAVLSALIFNAIIIPLLIPLAMRGIRFKPTSTMALFIKNAFIYGAGGIIVPFIGIKLIDIALLSLGG